MSSDQLTVADIAEIKEPKPPRSVGSDQDEKAFLAKVDRDKKKEELAALVQDRTERKNYAGKIFKLICYWLVGVFALIVVSGFGKSFPHEFQFNLGHHVFGFKGAIAFEISDAVLLAIVGGTTATVLGLFTIVANYLFPKRSNS